MFALEPSLSHLVTPSPRHFFRLRQLHQRRAQCLNELARADWADDQRRTIPARQRDQPLAVGGYEKHCPIRVELKWPLVAIHASVERAPQAEARHICQRGGGRDADDILEW